MRVRVISDPSEFQGLREAWNALAGDKTFRRWEWMWSWREAWGGGSQLAILQVADDAGATIGFAPWHATRSWRWGARLEFLGSGKACGDDVSLLAAPGREDEVVQAVADWLTDADNARQWDWIELDGVSADDPMVLRLEQTLGEAGAAVKRSPALSRWIVSLPPSWEEYVNQHGRNGRKHARKFMRTLEAPENGLAIVQPRTADECDAMYETVADLHQKRWEAVGVPGCFTDPRFEHMLRAVVGRWFAEGSLRLRILESEERPVAGVIAAVFGKTMSVYLVGRDPARDELHAGTIVSLAQIIESIGEGLTTMDFLRGNERYKTDLLGKPRDQVRVEVAGRGLVNRVRYLATAGQESAKRMVKRRLAGAGSGSK